MEAPLKSKRVAILKIITSPIKKNKINISGVKINIRYLKFVDIRDFKFLI